MLAWVQVVSRLRGAKVDRVSRSGQAPVKRHTAGNPYAYLGVGSIENVFPMMGTAHPRLDDLFRRRATTSHPRQVLSHSAAVAGRAASQACDSRQHPGTLVGKIMAVAHSPGAGECGCPEPPTY